MTSKDINNLVINKVENQEVYDYMVENNLINENELYLVEDDDKEKIEIDASLSSTSENPVQNKVITSEFSKYETKNDAEAKLGEAYTYTDTKTSDMATNSVVDNKISSHNISSTAHNDIRDLISGLTTRLNTLADSDDTTLDQLSEVVTYIKSNKSLIDSITTNKVNVSDIINNLTTNVTNKPLSAAQGVAIKTLIDDLQDEVDSHTHTVADVTDLTVTATELNYMDGVTSNVQSQLDGVIDAIDEAKISAITTNNEELNIDSLNVSVGGFNWDKLDDLPIELITSSVIALNNKIHILGSEDYKKCHYEFDGSTWTQLEDLPYEFYYSSAVVYNDEIHLLGTWYNYDTYREKHYKFDNTMSTWVSVSTLPYEFGRGSAVVYNDEIHILGGSLNSTSHYKFDNTTSTWISVSTLPYRFYDSSAVVYNDKIHLLGSSNYDYMRYHYEFDGSTWTQLEKLPYRFCDSSAVVYNDKIHLLGSEEIYYEKYHYEFDGFTWTRLEDLPYEFKNGSSVVYNDEIHILGTYQSTYEKCHYKLTVSEDKLISFTIDGDKTIPFVDINDEQSSTTSTYSSSKIENLIEDSIDNIELTNIDDENISTDNTYSSNKINELVNTKTSINDVRSSIETTYSSNKINELLNLSNSLEGGGANINDSLSSTITTYSSEKIENLIDDASFPAIVDNKLQVKIDSLNINSNSDYKWNELCDLPYDFSGGTIIEYNNEIHVLGNELLTEFYNDVYYLDDNENWIYSKDEEITFTTDYVAHSFVYNNELYATPSYYYIYKLNNYNWELFTKFPKRSDGSSEVSPFKIISYNNYIHILGDSSYNSSHVTCHFRYDGTSWEQLENLPYDINSGNVVVYDNEIHLLGGEQGSANVKHHYKWDGSTWTKLDNLPYEFYSGRAVVYNNCIHILGGCNFYYNHYKWDGSTWTKLDNLPYEFYDGGVIVYNNEIHLMGSADSYLTEEHFKFHYKYDGSTWTRLNDLPYEFYKGCSVVYNDKLYILGSSFNEYKNTNSHYKYNHTSWEQLENIPYEFKRGCAIVYNDELHLLGGESVRRHYKWNGNEYINVGDLPFGFRKGYTQCLILNNEIHMFGGNYSDSSSKHYKFNGLEWVEVSTLPVSSTPYAFVKNNELIICDYSLKCHKFSNGQWIEFELKEISSDIGGGSYGMVNIGNIPYIIDSSSRVYIINDDYKLIKIVDKSDYLINVSNFFKYSTYKEVFVYDNEINISINANDKNNEACNAIFRLSKDLRDLSNAKISNFNINNFSIPMVSIDDTLSSLNSTYSSDKIDNLLDNKIDSSSIVAVSNGGTGYDTLRDNSYSIPRYRASSLSSYETTPSTNGVIHWIFE